MPPSIIKTIRDEIFWQYAKLISKSAGFGINERAFQMSTFIKLRDGKIKWSSAIGEFIKEHEKKNSCTYCGFDEKLTLEHILPSIRGGPNIADNATFVCKKCNSSKRDKRLYEWFGYENKDKIPSIAEGKYLKLIYELHEKLETLNVSIKELKEKLCPRCDMGNLCIQIDKNGKLTVFCLEGIFNKRTK